MQIRPNLFILLFVTLSHCDHPKKDSEFLNKIESNTTFSEEISTDQFQGQIVNVLKLGDKAPFFRLLGVDGKYHTLDDYKSKVLVILFISNHCPTSQAYEDRVISFVDDYSQKDVQLVAISPNDATSINLEELGYTDLGDSYEEMIVRDLDKEFNFPYLYDGDTQATSIRYGPTATPHVFIFNDERLLQYSGRIDANENTIDGRAEDLRLAVDNILAGLNPVNPKTEPVGCKIKWKWNPNIVKLLNLQWEAQSVAIRDLDLQGLKTVLKNENSGKLRLVNLWTTDCSSCILDYPNLINLYRRFKGRNFEFVSLSLDPGSKWNNALKFLSDQSSSIKNYLYLDEDYSGLMENIDPNWNGALPYSLLIEPNGKVIWRHQGRINFQDLIFHLVDHELIGRYNFK